jgi:hypothetical protein
MEHQHQHHHDHSPISYTVDGKPFTAVEHELAAYQILERAGLNSESHYLVLLNGNDPDDRRSYREDPDEGIRLHPDMRFISEPKHRHLIHYTVDGEPQESRLHELRATEILEHAGLTPVANYYLIRLLPDGDQKSYKDHPEKEIHLHDGERFISASLAPTPVS